MVKLQWTPQAVEDYKQFLIISAKILVRLPGYLLKKSIIHVYQLVDYSKSGRTVPEIDNTDIRELIYRNCRIVYRIVNDEYVRILTRASF